MKCICKEKCFIKGPTGRNVRYNPGDSGDFKKCPASFKYVDSAEEIDFLTAGEEELLNAKWSLGAAQAIVMSTFNIAITGGTDKADVVRQIIDARERFVDTTQPNKAQ